MEPDHKHNSRPRKRGRGAKGQNEDAASRSHQDPAEGQPTRRHHQYHTRSEQKRRPSDDINEGDNCEYHNPSHRARRKRRPPGEGHSQPRGFHATPNGISSGNNSSNRPFPHQAKASNQASASSSSTTKKNKKNHRKKKPPPPRRDAKSKPRFVSPVDVPIPYEWVHLFPSAKKCVQVNPVESQRVLYWHSPMAPLPIHAEQRLLPTLLHWGKRERGMMCQQPAFRIEQIRKACQPQQQVSGGRRKTDTHAYTHTATGQGGTHPNDGVAVPLSIALSLRRHHIKYLNRYMSNKSALNLGSEEDIRESARLFEVAVEASLRRNQIEFWGEEEQREQVLNNKDPDDLYPPTPDFVLKQQVRLKKHGNATNPEDNILDEESISWIEAKMFYGASTIEHDNRSAVGRLLKTGRKYVRTYGKGAMIFMHGCGDRLAAELREIGVVVLDCNGTETVDLQGVKAHQRTWCADENGNILP